MQKNYLHLKIKKDIKIPTSTNLTTTPDLHFESKFGEVRLRCHGEQRRLQTFDFQCKKAN